MNKKTLTIKLNNVTAGNETVRCDWVEFPADQALIRLSDHLPADAASDYVVITAEGALNEEYVPYFIERIRGSKTLGGFSLGTATARTALFLAKAAYATVQRSTVPLPAEKLVEQLTEQIQKQRCFTIVNLAKESNRIGTNAAAATEAAEREEVELLHVDDLTVEEIFEQSKLVAECLKKQENARALDLIRLLGKSRESALELYFAEAIALQRLGRIDEAQESLNYLLARRPDHSGAQDLLRTLQA